MKKILASLIALIAIICICGVAYLMINIFIPNGSGDGEIEEVIDIPPTPDVEPVFSKDDYLMVGNKAYNDYVAETGKELESSKKISLMYEAIYREVFIRESADISKEIKVAESDIDKYLVNGEILLKEIVEVEKDGTTVNINFTEPSKLKVGDAYDNGKVIGIRKPSVEELRSDAKSRVAAIELVQILDRKTVDILGLNGSN